MGLPSDKEFKDGEVVDKKSIKTPAETPKPKK